MCKIIFRKTTKQKKDDELQMKDAKQFQNQDNPQKNLLNIPSTRLVNVIFDFMFLLDLSYCWKCLLKNGKFKNNI